MPSAATCMNLELIILNEVRQKDKYRGISLNVNSKMWHKWTDQQKRNRFSDREQICSCQGGWGWGRARCASLPTLPFSSAPEAWEAGSRSGRALLFCGPLGTPGDQAFAHSAHHPMAQTSFFLINSKQENICLQCVSCSVSFHLDENKALWWLQQKWHRTLRKLKNFGNWYVRDFFNHKRIFERKQRVL